MTEQSFCIGGDNQVIIACIVLSLASCLLFFLNNALWDSLPWINMFLGVIIILCWIGMLLVRPILVANGKTITYYPVCRKPQTKTFDDIVIVGWTTGNRGACYYRLYTPCYWCSIYGGYKGKTLLLQRLRRNSIPIVPDDIVARLMQTTAVTCYKDIVSLTASGTQLIYLWEDIFYLRETIWPDKTHMWTVYGEHTDEVLFVITDKVVDSNKFLEVAKKHVAIFNAGQRIQRSKIRKRHLV